MRLVRVGNLASAVWAHSFQGAHSAQGAKTAWHSGKARCARPPQSSGAGLPHHPSVPAVPDLQCKHKQQSHWGPLKGGSQGTSLETTLHITETRQQRQPHGSVTAEKPCNTHWQGCGPTAVGNESIYLAKTSHTATKGTEVYLIKA